jgi:hypothetical protein
MPSGCSIRARSTRSDLVIPGRAGARTRGDTREPLNPALTIPAPP